MKTTIDVYDFKQAFRDYDRQENFSNAGLDALFTFLEELEDDTGEEMELDVIALCCEFTEYENLEELQEDYSDIESMEDLEAHTLVIMIDDDSFIIQDY